MILIYFSQNKILLLYFSHIRRITCFSDSLQAVGLIRKRVSVHHQFTNKVFSIRQLFARDWEVVVDHTLREGNVCVDVLANMGVL
jgi:hypothetical protein